MDSVEPLPSANGFVNGACYICLHTLSDIFCLFGSLLLACLAGTFHVVAESSSTLSRETARRTTRRLLQVVVPRCLARNAFDPVVVLPCLVQRASLSLIFSWSYPQSAYPSTSASCTETVFGISSSTPLYEEKV